MLVVVLALAVPTTVMANKKLYKANISTANELHQVVGSSARGAGVFNSNPDGTVHFQIQIRNLSGQPTAVHLHASADTSQNAPARVTLCGSGPTPPVFATCTLDANSNTLTLIGDFDSSHFAGSGITGAQLQAALDGSLVYVNAHTELNPAGEARGQLIPQ